MGYGRLLSKEEKGEFIKDLVEKNYNPKNTCYMESQIHVNLKGTNCSEEMWIWFITYDENKEFENDVYFKSGYRRNEFNLEIRPHNGRKRTGKNYEFEVDEDKILEILKKICSEYSKGKSKWGNEAHSVPFYEAIYDVAKNAKEIYLKEYK